MQARDTHLSERPPWESRCIGRMQARLGPQPAFINALLRGRCPVPPSIPVPANAYIRAMWRRGSGIGRHGDAHPALNGAGTGTGHAQDTGQGTHAGAWPKRERGPKHETRRNRHKWQRKVEFESPANPGPAPKLHSGETGPARHSPLQAPTGPGPVQVQRSHEQGSQKEGSQPLR